MFGKFWLDCNGLCWLINDPSDLVAFVTYLRHFVTYGYARLPRDPVKNYRLRTMPSVKQFTLGSIKSEIIFGASQREG